MIAHATSWMTCPCDECSFVRKQIAMNDSRFDYLLEIADRTEQMWQEFEGGHDID